MKKHLLTIALIGALSAPSLQAKSHAFEPLPSSDTSHTREVAFPVESSPPSPLSAVIFGGVCGVITSLQSVVDGMLGRPLTRAQATTDIALSAVVCTFTSYLNQFLRAKNTSKSNGEHLGIANS
jgi:hypothetical protein